MSLEHPLLASLPFNIGPVELAIVLVTVVLVAIAATLRRAPTSTTSPAPSPSSLAREAAFPVSDHWYCVNCRSANAPGSGRCYSCGQRRAEAEARAENPSWSPVPPSNRAPTGLPPGTSGHAASAAVSTGANGTWFCQHCGYGNDAGAMWCARCKAGSPGSGTSARDVPSIDPYPVPPSGVLTLIRTYPGDKRAASLIYQQDAARLAQAGYRPTAVDWSPGQYSAVAFVVALILCVLLIGILVFIYMIIVKPAGTLTVTYTLEQPTARPEPAPQVSAPPTALTDRLQQLAAARDAGLISPQEHDTKRAELLAQF